MLMRCIILLLILTACPAMALERYALLIGIGQYKDPAIQTMQAPPYDVAAMRDVLRSRWGVSKITELVNENATRARILSELARLHSRSKPGDEVLIYFSGHGTSSHDTQRQLMLPDASGAFVPYDYPLASNDVAQLIVGHDDLRPLLQKLDAGGRKVWVIADTCYSGELVRSSFAAISSELPARLLTLRGKQVQPRHQNDHISANASAKHERAPYPYSRVQFLAAAASGELAREIQFDQLAKLPTRDNKPHGALTDALLRVLHGEIAADLNQDGLLSLHEVQIACAEFMASRPYNHSALRLPNLHEDSKSLGQQAVLSVRNVALKARPGALPALKLYIGSGLPDMGLSQLPAQEVVQAAFQVVLDANNADLHLTPNGDIFQLLTGSGDLLAKFDSREEGHIPKIRQQITQLAWVRQIRALAERDRRAALVMDMLPNGSGGNFLLGDRTGFALQAEHDALFIVLNINANGEISLLHPGSRALARVLPARSILQLPAVGPGYIAQEPTGIDFQLAFAFDSAPPGIEKLFDADKLPAGHPRLLAFVHGLREHKIGYSFGYSETRIYAAPK